MRQKFGSMNLAACAATAALVGITGVAIPLLRGGDPDSGCGGCRLEPGTASLDLDKSGGPNWCATFERYLESGPPPSNVDACPLQGPPDDPVVRDAAIPTTATPFKTVRVYFHIFRYNDGTGAVATPANLDAAMALAANRFNPWRIQFVYQWRYVNNSKYRDCAQNEEWAMKRAYALSPATQLNVYVVNTGGISHGTFPWTNPALTEQGGIVQNYSGMTSILTHEIGHCLGLWHTFHGVTEVAQCSDCYEPAGRAPEVGDATGDYCGDTNPTTNSGFCGDPGTIDPCSGNAFVNTPYDNVMGYSNCGVTFTAHQAGRMHAWTDHILTGWLVMPGPPAAPGTPTLTKLGGLAVRVAWADNSSDEDSFTVQRERKSGSIWVEQTTIGTVGAGTTSLDHTVPAAGTYRFRVSAANGFGSSAWSAWTQIKL